MKTILTPKLNIGTNNDDFLNNQITVTLTVIVNDKKIAIADMSPVELWRASGGVLKPKNFIEEINPGIYKYKSN
jgi:hypothetical protein